MGTKLPTPGTPKRIPGLPEDMRLQKFDAFQGLNTKAPRPKIADQEMSYCDSFMPLGKSNLRTMPDIGRAIMNVGNGVQFVCSITVIDGGIYSAPPTVTLVGGGGAGATATANVIGNTVVSVTINTSGTGYTSPPSVVFDTTFGSGAIATASLCSSPVNPFNPLGVHFDGATLVSTASLGILDSSQLSFSFWFNIPNGAVSETTWVVDPLVNDLTFDTVTQDAGGDINYSVLLQGLSQGQFQVGISNNPTPNNWNNILFSCDTNFAGGNRVAKLYFNGTDVTNILADSGIPFISSFNGLPLYIGGDTTNNYIGDYAEFWYAPGQSLLVAGDIPAATVAAFCGSGSTPIDLGSTGANPTGRSPAVYLSRRNSDLPSAFANNRGVGGSFSVIQGALTASATNP